MQLNINDAIAAQLQKRVDESSEFDSVEAYVEYVLGEVLKQTASSDDAYDEKQEDTVKQRLEDLGYLD